MGNDISNLFDKFGTNASGYLEVDNTNEYKELPRKLAEVPPARVPAPVRISKKEDAPASPSKNSTVVSAASSEKLPGLVAARIEPEIGHVTVPADAIGLVPTSVASLRSLLSEAALKREALARSEHEEAARNSAQHAVVPATPAKVIAIVSPKGGVGKTTLCAALAHTIKSEGRVIAIDLDAQNALQYHLGVDASVPTQADADQAGNNWSDLLLDAADGVHVLPFSVLAGKDAGQLTPQIAQDTQWLARQLAGMQLTANDVVILDTPTGQAEYLEQVLDVAQQIVVVVTADAGSFIALNQIGDRFEGRQHCSYVVNQFDASRTFSQDMLEVFKRRIGSKLTGVVSLDHAISEGLAYGVNVFKASTQSPVYEEIVAIGDTLKASLAVSGLSDGRAS